MQIPHRAFQVHFLTSDQVDILNASLRDVGGMGNSKSDKRWYQILQKERFTELFSGNKGPEEPPTTAKARRKWGSEAFLRSGEASFAGNEH